MKNEGQMSHAKELPKVVDKSQADIDTAIAGEVSASLRKLHAWLSEST